jgi:hypothetical protein
MVRVLFNLLAKAIGRFSSGSDASLSEMARTGDLDGLAGQIYSLGFENGEDVHLLYKWALVADDFGNKALQYFPELTFDDPETYASAHFDVGRWYLLGEEGLERNEELAFRHFNTAVVKYNLPRVLDYSTEIGIVRSKLEGEALEKFERLFPASGQAV